MLKVGIKSKSFEIENSFAHKGVWGEVGVIHLVGEDSAMVSLFYGDDNRKSRGTVQNENIIGNFLSKNIDIIYYSKNS